MPGVGHGMQSAGKRVDDYLSVLGGTAPEQESAAEANRLMEHLTYRPDSPAASDQGRRGRLKGLSLLAPLKRLRRNLFGGRG